jgi:hypothetical protein
MGFSQLGAVPTNQLDALPLFSAQQAANGGTVNLGFGGGLTRFWDPVTLGVSAANFAVDGNGFIVLTTNFISVFGCRSFALIITRTNAGVGGAIAAMTVRVQYRLTATDVPPTSLGPIQTVNYTGSTAVNTAAIVFPGMQAANELQRALIGWDSAEIVGFSGTAATIGDNVRIFLDINGGANPGVANIFSMYLYGSS